MKGDFPCRAIALALCMLAGCATMPKADQDLFLAVQADDPRAVEQSLASGARLDVHDGRYCEGLPPLGCAARWGAVASAESLLARGADVNGRGGDGRTPVGAAARAQQLPMARLLLRHGADVNAREKNGWTPLHDALVRLAESPDTEAPRPVDVTTTLDLVNLLLGAGAGAGARSDEGIAPIHVAAATRQTPLVQLLIDRGADVDVASAVGDTPLYFAAKHDAVDVAQLLLAHGAAIEARTQGGFTPLQAGVAAGNLDVSRFLVERGADVNGRDSAGHTPLVWAFNGLLERYTLDALTPGAESERHRMSTVRIARERELFRTIKGQFAEVALLLLEHGALPNVGAREHVPMRTAAVVGHRALVEALIARGGEVNPVSEGGLESPLHAAIAESHEDVAELLIEKGADVSARTSRGRTPLHFAVHYTNDRRLVELLVKHGADVNARDDESHSPLAFAMRENKQAVVEFLRQHGARE